MTDKSSVIGGNSFTGIPQDDGLMDLWIAGLLVLSSRKAIDAGF